ncbi:MAG: MaoC family dehydratase [Anaeromyxobacter sp.]
MTAKAPSEFAVGQTFQVVREVDPYRPFYYAAASGDFNPIHIDAAVGRAAGYGGVILQGMCTFSWLADACVAYLGAPERLTRIRARFTKPVAAGDTLTISGRCTALEGGKVKIELEVTNQHGDEVLKSGVAEGRVSGGAA